MRLAICDNCQGDIEYLKKLIGECKDQSDEIDFFEFTSGENLLEKFMKYDLIFLDIKLGGIDGIKIAESIRLRDLEVPIVFFTNYNVLAYEVVKIHPIYYLIKDKSYDEQKVIICDALKKVNEKESPHLSVKYMGQTYILDVSDIVYISIHNKGTAIWLNENRTKDILGEQKRSFDPIEYTILSNVKLKDYYNQLKSYGFLYAKKSYIVNIRYILKRKNDLLLLRNGYELTITRSKKKQFDIEYTEYWLKNTIGSQ